MYASALMKLGSAVRWWLIEFDETTSYRLWTGPMTGQPLLRDRFTCVLENASKKIGTRNVLFFKKKILMT